MHIYMQYIYIIIYIYASSYVCVFHGENADFADPELIYLFWAEFWGGPAGAYAEKRFSHQFTFSLPDLFPRFAFPRGKHSYERDFFAGKTNRGAT